MFDRLRSATAVATVILAMTTLTVDAHAADLTYARDSFARSASGQWGKADTGGSWTVSGEPSLFSVAGGIGRMAVAKGSGLGATLDAAASDTNVTVDLSSDKRPTGGGLYYSVVGRGTVATGYRSTVRVQSDGSVTLSLRRSVSGSDAILSSQTLAGVNAGAGTSLRLRMSTTGRAPTTIRAKVWVAGTSEPSTWALSASDSSTSVPATGQVALAAYLSGSSSDATVSFGFDNLVAVTEAAVSAPITSGKPTSSSTGVPDGTSLTVLSKSSKPYAADTLYSDGSVLVINTPNAVYDGWQFDSFVEVRAPGVRITRSLFRGIASSNERALLYVRPDTQPAGQPSVVVEDSTFSPRAPSNLVNGVQGSNFTLRRVEITRTVDGVHVHGTTTRTDPNAGHVTIDASWIHDLIHYNDSSHSDGSHNDGVQVSGGHNITITGSRIDGTIYNAGIMITAGRNNVYNVTIKNNRLAGGAATINVYDKNVSTGFTGMVMSNNVFTRGSTRLTDTAMLVTNNTRAIATASGNTWHNASTPLPTMRNGG